MSAPESNLNPDSEIGYKPSEFSMQSSNSDWEIIDADGEATTNNEQKAKPEIDSPAHVNDPLAAATNVDALKDTAAVSKEKSVSGSVVVRPGANDTINQQEEAVSVDAEPMDVTDLSASPKEDCSHVKVLSKNSPEPSKLEDELLAADDAMEDDDDFQLLDDVMSLEANGKNNEAVRSTEVVSNKDAVETEKSTKPNNDDSQAQSSESRKDVIEALTTDSGVDCAKQRLASDAGHNTESSADLSDNDTGDYSGDESSAAMSQSLDTTADSLFEVRETSESVASRARELNEGTVFKHWILQHLYRVSLISMMMMYIGLFHMLL